MIGGFLQGATDSAWSMIKDRILEPDISIWMGNKTDYEKGALVAKKVMTITIPLFINIFYATIGSGLAGLASGAIDLGLGLGVAALNIGKAWVINKLLDDLILNTSKYFIIKDEIKKVVDASAAVVIAVAFLVVSIVLPIFGPAAILSATINLGLSLGKLGKNAYELYEKRNSRLQQLQQRPLRQNQAASTDGRQAALIRQQLGGI